MTQSAAARGSARRWVGLGLLALVLVVVFVRLGAWQLARAHRPYVAKPGSTVALDQVSVLGQALAEGSAGQRVTATGTYDAAHQELVTRSDRLWVLTPLRLADGSALPVVRGSVASGAPAPPPPAGTVVVTGALEASEDPAAFPSPSPGQVVSITTDELVNRLPYSIRDGYLILTDQVPVSTLQPVAVPPAVRAGGLRWQNLTYAIQWWLFAAFTVFLLVRVIVDDRRRLALGTPSTGAELGSEHGADPAAGPDAGLPREGT